MLSSSSFRKVALASLLVLLAVVSSCSKSDRDAGGDHGRSVADTTLTRHAPEKEKSPEEVYQDLLDSAMEPVVCRTYIEGGRYSGFHFTMIGTQELSSLTGNELLFAFDGDVEIKAIDLVQQPDYLVINPDGYARTDASWCMVYGGAWEVHYKNLSLFGDYYSDFVREHDTPLQQQAAVGQFRDRLGEVFGMYDKIVEQAMTARYRADFDNVVAKDTHYDFDRKSLCIELDEDNGPETVILRFATMVHGNIPITGTFHINRWWHEYVANYDEVRTFVIPMDVDGAEEVIRTTGARPATIEFIFQNVKFVKKEHCSTMGVRVLAARLIASSGDGKRQYYKFYE